MLTRVALVAGVLMLLSAMTAPEAQAGNITVTTSASGTGGAGDCTLQEAIQAANTDTAVDGCAAGSGPDTILIGNCTVTLLGPFQTDPVDGPIGLPDITSEIIVQGLSSNVCVIERSSAAADFAIFRVAATGNLTIENLTVRGGQGIIGGAVINRGMLNINSSLLEGNVATGATGGGAIANLAGGTLNVSDSTFTGNSAPTGPGGAILNEGPLTITNTTFSGNTAGTRGGAIETFVGGANTSITDSDFFGNMAGTFGGAVHHHTSALTITTSDFFTNSAVDGGGAIEGFGAWQVTDSYFDGNDASTGSGGAIRYIGDSMMVSRSTFSNNVAADSGGAIELEGAASPNVKIVNSTLSGNITSNGGGGGIILRTGSVELNNVTIAENFGFSAGGGIFMSSTATSFIFRNTIVATNSSEGPAFDCFTEMPAVLTSQGHNLIGNNTGCTFAAGAGDIIGTSASPVDPKLGFLRPIGGFAPTHPLRPGSPALNAGDLGAPGSGGTACEATDQRGVGRPDPVFGVCDIGAYEGVLPLAELSVTKTDLPDPVTFGSNITYTITVTNNGPDTAPSVSLSDGLPNVTGFVSATPSQGSCDPPFGAQLFCNLGDVTNGSVVTVTLVFAANQAGTMTNSVFASSSADETNFLDNFASEDTTVLRDFDLAITKSDTPDPVVRGNNITYDIAVANQGAATINNVVVTDTLSGAAVNFVSATPSQGSCAPGPPITCSLGAITGQSSVSITIVVTTTVPGVVSDTAAATTTDTDPDLTNNSVTISTNVLGLADLSVTKTDAPDPVAAGANVTYTIVVTNNGPDLATGVTVSDVLGIGGTGVSIMTIQGTCTSGAGSSTPSCDLGTLASGASATVTYVVTADFPCLLQNFASVSANEFDTVPADNTASTTTTVSGAAGCVTFDNSSGDGLWITATNWSNDAVPSPSSCVVIPAGQTATLTSGAQLVDSLTVDGTLNISGGTLNTTTSFTVTGTLNVNGPTITITSAFTNNGAVAINSGKLALNGGGSSVGSFTFPAGAILEFAAGNYTLAAGSSVLGTGNGTVNIAGATVDVAGNYNSSTNLSAGTVNFNSVASSNSFFMTGGTQGGTGTLTITGSFQWNGGSLVGSGLTRDRGNGSIGGNVTLNGRTLNTEMFSCWCGGTINVGNGAVWNVFGTLSIQSDETMVFNQGGANLQMNVNGGVVHKSQSMVGTSTIPAVVTNTGGTVTVSAGTLSFTGSFTQASGTTSLFGGNIGGGITFSFNGGSLIGSGNIAGNVLNTAAAISPGVPTTGTISINGDYAQGAGGTLNIKLGGTAPGQFDVLSVDNIASLDGTLNVSSFMGFVPMTGDSFPVMNYSSVMGDFTSKLGLNISTPPLTATPQANSYLLAVQAVGMADLSVTKGDAPDPVAVGLDLTYTVTVSNGGPDDATNTVLTDALPAGVTFVSATPSQGMCSQAAGTVTCNLGTVTTSAPATVTIIIRPTAAAGSPISNTASITSDASDPDLANNSATASTAITLPTLMGPSPYLSVNDSPFLAAIQAGTVALETNEDGRFDVPGVTVNGGSPIAPSGITDSVDGDDGVVDGSGTAGRSFFFGAGSTGITFTFSAAALGGLPTRVGIVWTDGAGTTTFEAFDAAGASLGVIGPVAIADGSFGGGTGEDRFFGVTHSGGISAIRISNTAGGIEVDHLQYGPVPAAVNSDLTITKIAAPDPVDAGADVTYTIMVTNSGVGTATGVTVTDTLPAGVTFVSATPSQGTCSGTTTVTCNLGSLGTAAQATVTIVATVTGSGTINNTVTTAAGSNELFVFNNSAAASVSVNAMADLTVTKSDSPDPVAITDNVTYTVTVTNNGPSLATGVALNDTLPAGVTFVSATPTQGTCSQAAGTVTCNLGALNSNASATVTIIVTPTATATGTITNTAVVAANEADPNPNDNTATQDTTVVAASADVQVTKADAPDPVIINQNLTYTVTVRNNGPQAAQNVVLTDTLPAGPAFVSATAPCAQAAGTVTCDLGTLASGAQTVITIVVTPTAAGTLTNTASVSSTTADPNAANNSASTTTAVSAVPFTVSFPQGQPNTATVNSGGATTVTVTVTPNQPGITVSVACGPPLPPDTTCVSQPRVLVFPNLTPQTVTITIQTTLCILGSTPPRAPQFPPGDIRMIWPMLLVLTLLLWVGLARRDEQLKRLTPVVVLLVFVVLLGGCAAQGGPVVGPELPIGTLPGTYTVPMTFSSGGQSQTLNFVLTVNP